MSDSSAIGGTVAVTMVKFSFVCGVQLVRMRTPMCGAQAAPSSRTPVVSRANTFPTSRAT